MYLNLFNKKPTPLLLTLLSVSLIKSFKFFVCVGMNSVLHKSRFHKTLQFSQRRFFGSFEFFLAGFQHPARLIEYTILKGPGGGLPLHGFCGHQLFGYVLKSTHVVRDIA